MWYRVPKAVPGASGPAAAMLVLGACQLAVGLVTVGDRRLVGPGQPPRIVLCDVAKDSASWQCEHSAAPAVQARLFQPMMSGRRGNYRPPKGKNTMTAEDNTTHREARVCGLPERRQSSASASTPTPQPGQRHSADGRAAASRHRHVMNRALLLLLLAASLVTARADQLMPAQAGMSSGAAFVAYYWRARPGRTAEYNSYILGVAERIDEDARKAGVFEEVRTVTPTPGPDGTLPDWTHLRIFRLKNMAAVEQLGAGLDAATLRVVPDEAQRKANSTRSAELRDLVRREVWSELK